jgi:hypothetical protein
MSDQSTPSLFPEQGPQVKRCSCCEAHKPLADFVFDKKAKSKLSSQCRKCRLAVTKGWRARNKQYVRDKARERHLRKRAHVLISHARVRAVNAGIPCDLHLHIDDVQRRIDAGACELTGLPFSMSGERTWDTPSLDRIEPGLGYTYANLRVVCLAVNMAMGNWGLAVLHRIAVALVEAESPSSKRKRKGGES